MQTIKPFINSFTTLGKFLGQFQEGSRSSTPELKGLNDSHYEDFSAILETEHVHNPWFTRENLNRAILGITLMLKEKVLLRWLSKYNFPSLLPEQVKTVGLVLAGNIPLVGFHDIMCVLASGHAILAKPSSKDNRLIRKLVDVITDLDHIMGNRIRFTEDRLKGMDVVIATGSDNSARYFEYYFRDIPHIIRKNRNGIAVMTGKESEEDLEGIGHDIFTYFGLGCRNVTKIFVPESYDLKVMLGVLDRFHSLSQHHKYGNNVDYYRTIYMMNKEPILDNEALLLKEDSAIASPVGVVFYERYSEIDSVKQQLISRSEEIQCVVSIHPDIVGALQPGTTQEPMPWEYADGVDTIKFLTELK